MKVNDMLLQHLHVVNVSGRLSRWCARQCPEPKEPSAGERYTARTLAHTLTGHYLFIRLKWTAVVKGFLDKS